MLIRVTQKYSFFYAVITLQLDGLVAKSRTFFATVIFKALMGKNVSNALLYLIWDCFREG
ncbi:protein of unknown function [Vibrio tapetis subsp. tapetis]|uniref:Uncharacterized protein n=1 Tax=Vibrio tapetis subsp. tapetis TaxID=1671868 RepID=A0A2N8Z9M6_9VIBR|nr:protein of unknown function [Vibrio tapetis subsp. tapetis]